MVFGSLKRTACVDVCKGLVHPFQKAVPNSSMLDGVASNRTHGVHQIAWRLVLLPEMASRLFVQVRLDVFDLGGCKNVVLALGWS